MHACANSHCQSILSLCAPVGQRTLDDCFQLFAIIHKCTSDLPSIRRITAEVIHDFANDGGLYLELRTTPKHRPDAGMTKVRLSMGVAAMWNAAMQTIGQRCIRCLQIPSTQCRTWCHMTTPQADYAQAVLDGMRQAQQRESDHGRQVAIVPHAEALLQGVWLVLIVRVKR